MNCCLGFFPPPAPGPITWTGTLQDSHRFPPWCSTEIQNIFPILHLQGQHGQQRGSIEQVILLQFARLVFLGRESPRSCPDVAPEGCWEVGQSCWKGRMKSLLSQAALQARAPAEPVQQQGMLPAPRRGQHISRVQKGKDIQLLIK